MSNRAQALEIVAIRDGRVTDVAVDFGWSIPHDAAKGEFVATDHDEPEKDRNPGIWLWTQSGANPSLVSFP